MAALLYVRIRMDDLGMFDLKKWFAKHTCRWSPNTWNRGSSSTHQDVDASDLLWEQHVCKQLRFINCFEDPGRLASSGRLAGSHKALILSRLDCMVSGYNQHFETWTMENKVKLTEMKTMLLCVNYYEILAHKRCETCTKTQNMFQHSGQLTQNHGKT